jgi:AcrR family transcriptional regulator
MMADAHRHGDVDSSPRIDGKDGSEQQEDGRDRPLPASRHYRRAQRDRGAETRAQLIEAALDVFGRRGFEGASTREIAKAAGANLAAIVYHFGSKEALYIAVAEHIVTGINSRVGAVLAEAAEAPATPEAARGMLHRLVATYVEVLLDSAEAERWSRFLVREQMQPSSAFEIIFRLMGGSVSIANRLLAVAIGGDPMDEEIRVRSFAIFGQVMVFRVAHALVVRHMGWPSIGKRERDEIRRVVEIQLDAILDAGQSP